MGTLIGSTLRDVLCTEFNGSTQYGYVDNPTWKGDTQGCFALWYRPTTVLAAGGAKVVVSYGVKDAGNNSLFRIEQRHNASVLISPTYRNRPIASVIARTTNAGVINSAYGDHIFTAATWVLWVVQSNGSAWTHYINGVSVGGTNWIPSSANTGDWLGDISGSDHRLTVGAGFSSNALSAYDDNRTNELIYFRRPLTSGEQTSLYNGGTPRNPREVVTGSDIGSWWQMGDANDTNALIYDRVGSNDLILVNTPSIVAFP
jgi:hypothetical protein